MQDILENIMLHKVYQNDGILKHADFVYVHATISSHWAWRDVLMTEVPWFSSEHLFSIS